MTRSCTICLHEQRASIDMALVEGSPFRHIAAQFGTSTAALQRHKEHMPKELARAQQAQEVAQADDLLGQVRALRNKAISLLAKAEQAGDYGTALRGVREARACVELLLEVEGELDRRPQYNILVSPEWHTIRDVLVRTLQPYPTAAVVVAEKLHQLEVGQA